MRQQLEKRLQELKAEFATGQRMLAELEAKQANLKETLLRIAGAIQVLEEELGKAETGSTAVAAETMTVDTSSVDLVTEDGNRTTVSR